MSSNHDIKFIGGVFRSTRSREQLVSDGDFYGLYAKNFIGISDIPRPFRSRLAAASLAATSLALVASKEFLWTATGRFKSFSSGPLELWMHGNTRISAHYFGDQHTMKELDYDLQQVANKLSAYQGRLPNEIVAESSRDIISTVARKYGLQSRLSLGCYPGDAIDILAIADAARTVRGKKPCPDRNIYEISMSTSDFINRFSSFDEDSARQDS